MTTKTKKTLRSELESRGFMPSFRALNCYDLGSLRVAIGDDNDITIIKFRHRCGWSDVVHEIVLTNTPSATVLKIIDLIE